MTKLLWNLNSITKIAAMMKQVCLDTYDDVFTINCEGLSSLNSTKFDTKTCSQRSCYYSDNLLHSTWISSQVFPKFLNLWNAD